MENKRKLFLKWNAVAKAAVVLLIVLLGSSQVHAQTLTPPSKTGPVLSEFDREYNYGYAEGEKYASRKDRAGYEAMLKRYYEGLRLYPEDADFYQGRIQGLTYGWLDNQPEADFSTYNKLLKSLQRNSSEP
ncbi:hypothetical protein [Chitinophaga sp. OAE865]|uniref:hypothetical protein n=1 Tax=Chitinophaga sp. OAE865 TaxID=2817898 RepID=UPI001AE3C813